MLKSEKMKYKEKETLYLDSLNFWAILMQIASTCDGDFASSSSGSSSSSSEAKGESRTLHCRRRAAAATTAVCSKPGAVTAWTAPYLPHSIALSDGFAAAATALVAAISYT